jgi:hypothetical protein
MINNSDSTGDLTLASEEEKRDSRSPRSSSAHGSRRRRDSQHRSPSRNSPRSRSPTAEETSRRSSESGQAVTHVKNRRTSKSTGPKLNTWDIPEFLPGALPRANPVQRAFFEERSKKVFENNRVMDAIDAEESEARFDAEQVELIESHIKSLGELFPALDIELIQETYFGLECNYEEAVNQFLRLSPPDEVNSGDWKGPPSSDDEREYPALKASELPSTEFDIEIVEREMDYKKRLMETQDPPR